MTEVQISEEQHAYHAEIRNRAVAPFLLPLRLVNRTSLRGSDTDRDLDSIQSDQEGLINLAISPTGPLHFNGTLDQPLQEADVEVQCSPAMNQHNQRFIDTWTQKRTLLSAVIAALDGRCCTKR
ncbi:hypothetical protein JMM63_18785 [Rhodovulum sulfidophilum]|uniref:hypothetical protein n=1 Tax=Rhodovulum sulfidophilum TaxID=35806 RepID=UPI001921E610|nr:hypothetical protein [Rhodovulum sulfidophilum]MBL3597581.1 hypothetical protein [Rhodovulum sulfidophilum]